MTCVDHVQRGRKTLISIQLLDPVDLVHYMTVSVTVFDSDIGPAVPITVTV